MYTCAYYTNLKATLVLNELIVKGGDKMLSRDCDGCTQIHICSERYKQVARNGKVYCPDGTAHLVDQG